MVWVGLVGECPLLVSVTAGHPGVEAASGTPVASGAAVQGRTWWLGQGGGPRTRQQRYWGSEEAGVQDVLS